MTIRIGKALAKGILALTILSAAAGCASTLRYPARELPSDFTPDRALLDGMNVHLLTNLWTQRLVVEVDWVEGVEPSDKALAAFEQTLRSIAPSDKSIDVVLDDRIPLAEWESLPGSDLSPLAQRYLDVVPDWDAGRHVIYVLYAPRSTKDRRLESFYGIFTTWWVERELDWSPVQGIAIFLEPIRRSTIPPVRNVEGERATLMHELGHAFGLCSNWAHEARGRPNHCRNVQCLVTQPGSRSAAYNFLPSLFTGNLPAGYCPDCRTDLAQFKARVAREAKADPAWAARRFARVRAEIEAEATLRRARDLAESGNGADTEDADLAHLEATFRRHPESVELASRAALEALRIGRTEDALSFALEGVEIDPYHEIGLRAAALLARRGREGEALGILDDDYLAAYGQDGLDAHLERARILSNLGRTKDAMWLLRDARRTRRDDPGAIAQLTLGLGKLMRLQGRPRRALYQLKKTPRGMELDSRVVFERYKSLQLLGKRSRADRELEHYIEWSETARSHLGSPPDAAAWVLAEAKLGRRSQVDELLRSLSPYAERWEYLPILRAQAATQLGDLDVAWGIVESPGFERARRRWWTFDPCADEEIAPLRRDERFTTRFPECRSGSRTVSAP